MGISILSGSHLTLIPEVIEAMRSQGVEAAVVVGGIIPDDDAVDLRAAGVAAVYTPKDFEMVQIMEDLISIVEARRS